MRYEIRGVSIRSENAAKPISQPSKWVLDWIQELPHSAKALDFGCGKFRYTVPLSSVVGRVDAVDSRRQLDRQQVINGKKTSLGEYANKHLSNVRVYSESSAVWRRRRYDVILLTNVLSAIPFRNHRIDILRRLKLTLKQRGKILIVTQFADAHFSSYRQSPRASRYRDGWLVTARSGSSFYATIDLRSLSRHCRDAGLKIAERGVIRRGKSAYILAVR